MNGFAVAMRTYHCHVTSPLTPIPTPDRKLSFEHRNPLQNCARLIPPATAAHLSPRSNLWDSEEERDYPAPSSGCRVLSPFSRHSRVILRVVPHRNCPLLYISANSFQQFSKTAPPARRALQLPHPLPARFLTAPAPRNRSYSGMCTLLNRTCSPHHLLFRMNGIPAIHPWEKTYEVQISFTASRGRFAGGIPGLRR